MLPPPLTVSLTVKRPVFFYDRPKVDNDSKLFLVCDLIIIINRSDASLGWYTKGYLHKQEALSGARRTSVADYKLCTSSAARNLFAVGFYAWIVKPQ